MNEKQSLLFFHCVCLSNCWEENDHVSSTVVFPIGCRSRKSLFICIKLKDSELCRVAGHGRYRSRRRKSPALHWNEWDRVALSLSVACSVNGAEDVALDLQSIESKSAKACLLELYVDILLDEHPVCRLLFHRYRPRYHYDIITSLLYLIH